MMYWGLKLYRADDYAGARRVFEKLLAADVNPDASADAAFWIAKCSVAEGKMNTAKIQLADVIKRFGGSYQEFRARSILKALGKAQRVYSQQTRDQWQSLLVADRRNFVSFEVASADSAYESLAKELPNVDSNTLERLRFLMTNYLVEAQWELSHVSRKTAGKDARYALAWALFHMRAYNDAIKLASSLRRELTEPLPSARINYLLYPLAYPDIVTAETEKYKIDPMFTLSVMREESHFRERVVSRSDARGLMQIIPSTGEWLAGKVFGPAGFETAMLFQPSINIELGTYYLRYLLDRFDNNVVLATAGYNWGPTSLSRWMNDSAPVDMDVFIESIPAQETRRYVKKVLRSYATYRSLYPRDVLEEKRR
jgi:soluble lytic murein transglycosylase-like protein